MGDDLPVRASGALSPERFAELGRIPQGLQALLRREDAENRLVPTVFNKAKVLHSRRICGPGERARIITAPKAVPDDAARRFAIAEDNVRRETMPGFNKGRRWTRRRKHSGSARQTSPVAAAGSHSAVDGLASLEFAMHVKLRIPLPLIVRRGIKVAIGRDMFIRPTLPRPFLRLGDESAWNIDADTVLDADSVVYSVGVGWDISFDRELIARFGCTIHAFDPTPSSLEWLRSQAVPHGFKIHPYGLAEYDGRATIEWIGAPRSFQPSTPEREGHPGVPVRRLSSAMQDLGHRRIDLLKLDIEGAEYAVVDDMLTCGIHPTQLLIEYHHRFRGVGPSKTRSSVDMLRNAGYELVSVSDTGEEFCFVHPAFLQTHDKMQ